MMKEYATSAEQGLLLGIAIERYTGHYYEMWAERLACIDAQMSEYLRELAREERLHEAELCAKYRASFAAEPDKVTPPSELLRYTSGILALQKQFTITGLNPAYPLLEIALAFERYAVQFYRQLAANTSDPGLIAMYQELVSFEEEHERTFELKLAQMCEHRPSQDP